MNESHNNRVENLLESIRKRPGVYLGYASLTRLSFTISGYEHALYEDGQKTSALSGFQEWVAEHYGIHSSHHWSSMILFFEQSEEQAFLKFYELYDQYKETSAGGVESKNSDDVE